MSFLLGGIVKGATGAGAPLLAVPVLALYYDVPTAVTIFVMPNIFSNSGQGFFHRQHQLPLAFTVRFAAFGALGAGIGTLLLVKLPSNALSIFMAVCIIIYIATRLLLPNWRLTYNKALPLAIPAGTLAGIMQGATGISAPASLTFLSAMRLERLQFIATISIFFTAIGLIQLPLLIAFGQMTTKLFLMSCAAMLPLVAGMWIGSRLAKHISKAVFDRLILGLLAVIAVRLVFGR